MPRKRVPKIPELRGTRKFSLLHYVDGFLSFDRTPERERAIQNNFKLCELAKLYGISLKGPNATYDLLLRVCKDYVPGFNDPTALEMKTWSSLGGAPRTWTPELDEQLISEVDHRIGRGKSVMVACNALALKDEFKGRKATTLSRRYYALKKPVLKP
jgi:hypothetical protein